ncbi:MAG: hypothetical protein ABUL60_15450 [Myxococcales bacterium]
MADWSYKSWLANGAVLALALSVAGGVGGCSKKKEEDAKAKAEKALADAKKKPPGDRYADGQRLATALKEWSKRWSDTADLPSCEPLLKKADEVELCKNAQAALTTMKTAAAKPEGEAEAVLVHAAAELAFATEAASEKLRNAFMEKTQAEHKATPAASGAPGAKPPALSTLPRTRPIGSAGKAALVDRLADKGKGLEAAPLDPDQQVMQAYSRVNRASLRYLSQFLQFGPLKTRNATFAELDALSHRKEVWPALGRTLREAAMAENDLDLQGKLKALAPKLSRRPPGALPGMPPGLPGMPPPGMPSGHPPMPGPDNAPPPTSAKP